MLPRFPTRRIAAAVVLFCSLAPGCATSSSAPPPGKPEGVVHTATAQDLAATRAKSAIDADTAILYVNGLGCPLCATNIDKQLARIPGVRTVGVDLSTGKVTLGMTPGATHPSPLTLSEAVEDAGFTLVKVETK